jgi:hypothetical protein
MEQGRSARPTCCCRCTGGSRAALKSCAAQLFFARTILAFELERMKTAGLIVRGATPGGPFCRACLQAHPHASRG